MADTNIEWAEHSWNPIVGCSLASPGCTNCYAMKMAGRIEATGHPVYQGLTRRSKAGFVWTGQLVFSEKALLEPLRRRKPTRYFVNSMGDLFHWGVPDEWIDRVFALMALAPQHTFLVLTKRSARMRAYCADPETPERIGLAQQRIDPESTCYERVDQDGFWPLPNVWAGVSVEDQAHADERIPNLLATPARVRWLSCEPLLGPIQFAKVPGFNRVGLSPFKWWIVAGGESGPGARGSTAEVEAWMRSLRDQCAAAGVPFFGKQNFAKQPLPADLMVREYPQARQPETT